jgi:hypothetical protein
MQAVEKNLHEWRSYPTTAQIATEVINVAAKVCPGVNIYVALLGSGGKHMDYVACSENSNMTGNILHAEEGVSFNVVDHQVLSCCDATFVSCGKPNFYVSYFCIRKLFLWKKASLTKASS